ncbi:SMP-30/gluconolactonase/LRE family protein [Nocardia sp. NPDC058633]|uniref:SMP-30/gluconolactonase/LRE family protein n=1 Tax=Nocardia sp. NPDC058633 TaxID=3346568 RepID=UPI0036618078
MAEALPPPHLLLDDLIMVESGRWHDGRLWFAHWGGGDVVAVDLDGQAEVVAPGRATMGWSIDWLPDGRLLVSGEVLTRVEPDGSTVRHSAQGGNELVVDRAGHVYVNGADFDFLGGGAPEPGWIRLVHPDGSTRDVAGDIDFPNGMVITPDGSTLVIAESFAGRLSAFDIGDDGSLSRRRTWAEGLGPDGICIDADGGIWCQTADVSDPHDESAPTGAVVRVLEGGEITHRVETDLPCFSCALGGPQGRHLFLLCNEFEGIDQLEAVMSRRSARIYVTEVPSRH